MKGVMDDGQVGNVLIPNSDLSSNIQAPVSGDSFPFLDELLSNAQTCTHTHACNPPGPDVEHTHTCYHTHTQIIHSEEVDVPTVSKNLTSKSRRPSGNREAVRKYREKKKAHTAYLEEEVKNLRFVNQNLIWKLQRQSILEAEFVRLREVLLDIGGKIEKELGNFPFQKECNSSSTVAKEGDCGIQYPGGEMGLQCENDLTCFHPQEGSSVGVSGFGECEKMGNFRIRNCESGIADCEDNANARGTSEKCGLDSLEIMVSSTSQVDE